MLYSAPVIEGKIPFHYNIVTILFSMVNKGGNMLTILSEHKLLMILCLSFLLLSIICQIISGVIYQGMIKETDNMSATDNKLLKQCRQKYANYFKLNGKMVNTAVFVDKFLQKICICKVNLSRLTHISGQLMMLSILMIGVSVCLTLAAGGTLFQIIPYYLVSILGLYLYFSVSGMIDIQEKKKVLKINLTDYLENHFAPRLEIEKENALEEGIKKREVYAKEFPLEFRNREIEKEDVRETVEQKEDTLTMQTSHKTYSRENEEELENLLEEFFA